MKQGTTLNNKQQNSSKANITNSASVTSSIRGLQMAPTQLGAKPSAVSVKNWANTSANLQQLNFDYQVKQPKNDITERDNTITTSSLLIRKLRKNTLLNNMSIPIDCIKITMKNNHFIDNLNLFPVAPEQQRIRNTYM